MEITSNAPGQSKRLPRVALLLSASSFEEFYTTNFGLSREKYLSDYRNDFSWVYAVSFAKRNKAQFTIYLPTLKDAGVYHVEHDIRVRFLPLSDWYHVFNRLRGLLRTRLGRYAFDLINALGFWQSLRRALSDDRLDILYVQDYWNGRFDFLARVSPAPIVAIDSGGLREKTIAWFKRGAFKKARGIVGQSADELAIVKKFGTNAVYVPNGIDVDFFHSDDHVEREQWIFIVARLFNDQKRITDLIQALALVPPPWRLKIAGAGPDEALLRALADKLKLTARVDFLGFMMDKSVLRSHYQRCGVFALSSAREAVALVALEAMSCGAPVVVTDIRAFREVVEQDVNGIVVPVGDVQGLADGVLEAARRGAVLGRAARDTVVAKYSIDACIDKLASFIDGAH